MTGDKGFAIGTDERHRTDAFLFGEGQSRVVVTITPDQVAHARAIVAAFAAEPSAGVLSVDGRMVDKPHLIQAQRTLARAGE